MNRDANPIKWMKKEQPMMADENRKKAPKKRRKRGVTYSPKE